MRLLVVVLAITATLLFLQFSITRADDSSLFFKLWEQINGIVTPNIPDREQVVSSLKAPPPSEVFHMSMPGVGINWEDYDDALFNANNQAGIDPDLLRFQLVDMIPARAPYFVDSGRRLSNLYKVLLTNFIDPTNATSYNSSSNPEYARALKLVFNTDYSASGLVKFVNQTRDIARETFNRVSRIRVDCLLNESPDICARKMALYQSEVENQNLVYQLSRRYLTGGFTKLLATHTRNINTIMTKSFQSYLSNLRTGVGGRSFSESYLLTRYEPANFHCWWNPKATDADCATRESAFALLRINHTASDTKTTNSVYSSTFGSFSSNSYLTYNYNYPPGFIWVTTRGSSSVSNGYSQATSSSSSSSILMEFKIAQVRAYRPWFNPDIFDFHPLGIAETPINYWSDGNYGGIAASYITRLIVCKEVRIVFSETNTALEAAYQSSVVDSAGFSFGPWSVNSNNYNSARTSQRSQSSYNAQTRELYIKGPQIIGYVSSKIPAFPNYQKLST